MFRRAPFAHPNATLDPLQAWHVIEPHWKTIVAAFERKGYREPGRIRVECDPKWHDTCRHYAAMTTDARSLHFAPQMADLPPENIQGILAHEAGHLVDYANPGRYWYRPAARINVREGVRVVSVLDVDPDSKGSVLFYYEVLPKRNLAKHLRDWEARPRDEIEMCADAIAGAVLGIEIGYTGEPSCLIQTLGAGKPRRPGER